jgi:hypothetical protein
LGFGLLEGDDMTLEIFDIDSRIRACRSNIERYRQLLATELTDLERSFIHRRLAEDRLALDALTRLQTDPAGGSATSGAAKSAEHPAL